MFAPWERGAFSSADWADPEIEFVVADGPQPSRSHGVGEMARAWAEFLGAADHLSVHADEYRELEDSRVLVLATPPDTATQAEWSSTKCVQEPTSTASKTAR